MRRCQKRRIFFISSIRFDLIFFCAEAIAPESERLRFIPKVCRFGDLLFPVFSGNRGSR